MKRTTRKFLLFAKQLDAELTKQADIFLKERPYITDYSKVDEIYERSDQDIDEKITNEFTISKLITELRHTAKM